MDKFINLFTDFGFKKIFGTEPNKDLLIHFLNTLLVGRERIQDLTYLKNERLAKHKGERHAVYDLFCENEKGEKLIVEVQRVKQEFFKDRSIYYSSFAIQEQALKGKGWDYELKAVYTIAILDFSFEENLQEKLLHRVQLLDIETQEVFYPKLTYIYVEIPKFNKELTELENDFERWLYAFKNLHKLRDRPDHLLQGIFLRLMELAEIACLSKKDQAVYRESLKDYWDLKSAINTSFKEGKEEGLQIGLEKGEQIGLEKGKQIGEYEKSLKTAEKSLKKGLSIEDTAELTELPLEEIRKLAKKLGV